MSQDSFQPAGTDASDLYFCIIASRYNNSLVDDLLNSVRDTLSEARVGPANIQIMRVPGANEIPYAAFMQGLSRQFDCIIALGVVVAGETSHHSVIADTTATMLQEVGMRTECPVINGILTVDTAAQAADRISGGMRRGREFAAAAIEMARHKIRFVELLDELEDQDGEGGDSDDLEDSFRRN